MGGALVWKKKLAKSSLERINVSGLVKSEGLLMMRLFIAINEDRFFLSRY